MTTGTILLFTVGMFVFVISCLRERARQRALWPAGQVPTLEDIKRIAQSGEKILAIKLYRENYNTSLKDSKDAVEKLVE